MTKALPIVSIVAGDGDDGETYLTPTNKTTGDTIFITER